MPKPYRHRYYRIISFFARVIANLVFWDLLLPRLGLKRLTRQTRSRRMQKIAIAYRGLAIQMGGVLIKVGQFLSTRVDVLPIEITQELTGLQDEVPPENFEDIRRVAEAELGGTLEKTFAWFEKTPLAAASLGQAHRARLVEPSPTALTQPQPGGGTDPEQPPSPAGMPRPAYPFNEVVVKVQRPNIDKIIEIDLAALRTVGNWLKRYPPIRRRADVPALLKEFSASLYEEIDYLAEARNAETFAANFRWHFTSHGPGVRVPRVVWTHTARRVLTLENVEGIKITDYEAIDRAGINRTEVAQHLFETYLLQIFEHGFFHADPHPGNLFVAPLPAEVGRPPSPSGSGAGGEGNTPWELTFIDFGMVGHVPENLHEGLREIVIATGTQDPSRMVRAYQTMGVLLPSADTELLERAEARLFERFWGKSMSELRDTSMDEMQEFAKEFRELIFAMPFQVPEDLILLGRTVAILSGMCTGLNPNFNVWQSISPYTQKMIAEDGLVGGWETWQHELEKFLRGLITLPGRIDRVLDKMEHGKLEVRSPDVRVQTTKMETGLRRVAGAIVFAALLLGGIQLVLAGHQEVGSGLIASAVIVFGWGVIR